MKLLLYTYLKRLEYRFTRLTLTVVNAGVYLPDEIDPNGLSEALHVWVIDLGAQRSLN